MDQNQTTDNDDLQKAIDEITKTTSKDPVFSDPVPAPSTIPEGDNGMINDQVGPFPDLEAQFNTSAQNPIENPENPNPFLSENNLATSTSSLPLQQPTSTDFLTNPTPSMDLPLPETPTASTDFSNTQTPSIDPSIPESQAPSTEFSPTQAPTPSTEELSSVSDFTTDETSTRPTNSLDTGLATDSATLESSTTSATPITPAPTEMDESLSPTLTLGNTTSSSGAQIKAAALQDLAPLIGKLTLEPSQKFHLYQSIMNDSNDETLLEAAYQSAREIPDETERAEALLYIIESIK